MTVSAARRRCWIGRYGKEKEGRAARFELHRRVSYAYAMIEMARVVPVFRAGIDEVDALALTHGLDPRRCERRPEMCKGTDTPWGLAHAIGRDVASWAERDGFNAEGTYRREYNPRPFSDWRDKPYVPVNAPWAVLDLKRWSPLVEVKPSGLSFWQQHVTPHIGETGKSLYLGDTEVCRRSTVKDPRYDLREELDAVLTRSAGLDDLKKAEIEFFDNKLESLTPLQGQFFTRLGITLDEFEFWKWNLAVNTTIYESVVVVWQIKVNHDLVRPTTVAEALGVGKMARTFAGPNKGITSIPVEQWEPYIRTMPHGKLLQCQRLRLFILFSVLCVWSTSNLRRLTDFLLRRSPFFKLTYSHHHAHLAEFPSASSCLCSVYAEVHNAFLTRRGNGTSFQAALGGPLTFDILAGSSRIEKSRPPKNITLSYGNWNQVADVCSESRLNGGMHFRAAIPAGRDACKGIGSAAVKAVLALANGKRPTAYVAEFDSPRPRQIDVTRRIGDYDLQDFCSRIQCPSTLIISFSVPLAICFRTTNLDGGTFFHSRYYHLKFQTILASEVWTSQFFLRTTRRL